MPYRPPIHNAHDRKAEYERQRGSSRAQGYTARWDRLSRHYRRMHPLCVGCESVGRTTLAQVVDHVLPAKRDDDRMWSVDNLQALCKWHHDVVKQRLEQLHAQGLISDSGLRMDSAKAVP